MSSQQNEIDIGVLSENKTNEESGQAKAP